MGRNGQTQHPTDEELAGVYKKAKEQGNLECAQKPKNELWQRFPKKMSEWIERKFAKLFRDFNIKNNPVILDNLKRRTLDLISEKWEDDTILDGFDALNKCFKDYLRHFISSTVPDEQLALVCQAAKEQGDSVSANEAETELWGRFESKITEWVHQNVAELSGNLQLTDNLAIRNNLIGLKLNLIKRKWENGTILDSFDPVDSIDVHIQKFVKGVVPDEQLALEYKEAKNQGDEQGAKIARDKLWVRYCYSQQFSKQAPDSHLSAPDLPGVTGMWINSDTLYWHFYSHGFCNEVAVLAWDLIAKKWERVNESGLLDCDILKRFDPSQSFPDWYRIIVSNKVRDAAGYIWRRYQLKTDRVFLDEVGFPEAVLPKELEEITEESIADQQWNRLLRISLATRTLAEIDNGFYDDLKQEQYEALAELVGGDAEDIKRRLDECVLALGQEIEKKELEGKRAVRRATKRLRLAEKYVSRLRKQSGLVEQEELEAAREREEQARSQYDRATNHLLNLKTTLTRPQITWILLGYDNPDVTHMIEKRLSRHYREYRSDSTRAERELSALENCLVEEQGTSGLEGPIGHTWRCIARFSQNRSIPQFAHIGYNDDCMAVPIQTVLETLPTPGKLPKKPRESDGEEIWEAWMLEFEEWGKRWTLLLDWLTNKLRSLTDDCWVVKQYIVRLKLYVQHFVIGKQ